MCSLSDLAPPLAGYEPDQSSWRSLVDTQAEVISNDAVNPEYRHLVLRANGPALNAKPGQFFNIECPSTEYGSPYLRRPMSVFKAAPDLERVEFLYKVTGIGTRAMATLCIGARLRIFGPLGNGFRLEKHWKHIVVVARGVGLATVAPLAEAAAERGIQVTAVLSARSTALLMSADRFAAAGAQVEPVTDEDMSGHPQQIEQFLRGLIERERVDAFFTCGSNRLLVLLKRLGREFDIPGQVALEQQMACGMGMCFCCVRNFQTADGIEQRRVCFEGPVFELAEALPW
jgi:dihydroorotate dehydrogenase electron transfer subunit